MTRIEKITEGVGIWTAYYRARPHEFAEDYLHLDLKLFQKILLVAMNISTIFIIAEIFIASFTSSTPQRFNFAISKPNFCLNVPFCELNG